MGLISVIVTTYNWPGALEQTLLSLFAQQDRRFEIIIADDGSRLEIHRFIEQMIAASSVEIKHIFHDDMGFRAGTIRNKAVAASKGEYLIFLDGDCSTLPHFIQRHRKLAETGYFVPGNRILLSKKFTQTVLDKNIPLYDKHFTFFLLLWFRRHINRLLPLLYFPVNFFRCLHPTRWQKAMTCNLALWKEDFIAVNGFDEKFEGWGYEDSDLVIRLIHNGIKRKEGRFAVPVLHLWHKQNDRSNHDENYQRLLERIKQKAFVEAAKGIAQYL